MNTKFSMIVASLALFGAAHRSWADPEHPPSTTRWQTGCVALASSNFSGIIDAPTRISQAKAIKASDDLPDYCQVEGYVSPQVGFKLGLPANWNGKFLELGCGGDCGDTTSFKSECAAALRRGYACVVSDEGHTGGGGLWAYNNLQAQVDFGYRGPHVTALASKALIEDYYERPPKHSYFMGISTGGRQALVEAQRFPWDFDGIIGIAPWINDSDSTMQYIWNDRILSRKDGKPLLTSTDLQWVHDAALAKCDLDDGVRDGIISNPSACAFDPTELLCKAGKNSGCLTAAKADAVKKIYVGPTNSQGEKIYTGGSPIGSELDWVDANLASWAVPYYRYEVMPALGPGWQESDFNFDSDYKRFAGGVQESLLNAANPDLRKFKAAGGKLMIYQGWSDPAVVPVNTIDYYETVERTMGGRAATEEFFRLFMVPGMGHGCDDKGACVIDYMSYLEAWVEHGEPPDRITGAHINERYLAAQANPSEIQALMVAYPSLVSKETSIRVALGLDRLRFPLEAGVPVTYSRPVFPYPRYAKYKGSGDPNDGANFEPVGP